jgi:hypothetical protein
LSNADATVCLGDDGLAAAPATNSTVSACTSVQCCQLTATCSTVTCGDGYTRNEAAAATTCATPTCTTDECCIADTCASAGVVCATGSLPIATFALLDCAAGCNEALCCRSAHKCTGTFNRVLASANHY